MGSYSEPHSVQGCVAIHESAYLQSSRLEAHALGVVPFVSEDPAPFPSSGRQRMFQFMSQPMRARSAIGILGE